MHDVQVRELQDAVAVEVEPVHPLGIHPHLVDVSMEAVAKQLHDQSGAGPVAVDADEVTAAAAEHHLRGGERDAMGA